MNAYWLDDFKPAHPEALGIEGVTSTTVVGDREEFLSGLMGTHGYVLRDEVMLSPASETFENLSTTFAREHLHDDDEVRFVVEGGGVFDIRTRDDRWLRVVVGAGDLIIIPAGRHHRFYLSTQMHEHSHIRSVRLFKSADGWKPSFRV